MNTRTLWGIMLIATALLWASIALTAQAGPYEKGAAAYQKGDYVQTAQIFDKLLKKSPDNPRYAYYLAIASARLGRIAEARAAYEAVLLAAPDGPEAALAQEGLRYLPALALQVAQGDRKDNAQSAQKFEAQSDAPLAPVLRSAPLQPVAAAAATTVSPSAPVASAVNAGSPAASAQQASPAPPTVSTPVPAASATPAWTPQEAMAMQMLMSSMGANAMGNSMANPSGVNAIQPWMTTPQAMPGANGQPPAAALDPAALNAMMMSQMMGSMDMMGGSQDPNRDER
ncbi:MAG: tetratricopeptide repeat protein [Vampirovibrionales bacterium]|nr:tetratricopeptide repeat protein [Vampirovibrionales bacterium]